MSGPAQGASPGDTPSATAWSAPAQPVAFDALAAQAAPEETPTVVGAAWPFGPGPVPAGTPPVRVQHPDPASPAGQYPGSAGLAEYHPDPASPAGQYPDSAGLAGQHPGSAGLAGYHPDPVDPWEHRPAEEGKRPGVAVSYEPGPTPGAAQDPWVAPGEGRKRKTLWLVTGGAIALVVVVAAGAFFVWSKFSGDGGAQAAQDRQVAVEGTVTSYLEAIATGDAATALGHLAEEPDSTRLLTDDVLAASNETAALTGIEVRAGTATGSTAEVKASYRLGDTDVDQTFTVTERDGGWAIVDGTATVDLSVSTGDLSLAVNGQAVTDASAVVLFPGSYALTVAGDPAAYVTLGAATFQVTSSGEVKAPTITATLTDEGVAAFRQAVRASVEACVASPNLESGCPRSGLDVPASMEDGTVVTEGTVVRTLSPELSAEFDTLVPRLSGTNPARAFAVAPTGLVNIVVTGVKDGQTVAGDVINGDTNAPGFPLGTPEVDMTDPALPVTWFGR